MADNEKLDFEINLDAREMLDGLKNIQESLTKIGEPSQLEGLVSGLSKAAAAAGPVIAAFLAVKVALDTVFDAEKIKQTNAQFETLAASAGMMGSRLKQDLVAASKGMVGDTELMQAANKAIIELGDNSNKIPAIMELARKSTAVFGGEAVDRFEQITHAIAIGSERQLRQLNLQVDVNAAYEKYAKTLGLAANQLSETDKQQAMLNAVLDKGKESFKNVNESTLEATNSWKQLVAIMHQVMEIGTLLFDKILGPSVKSFLSLTKNSADSLKDLLVDKFGVGSEQAQAHSKRIQQSIGELEQKIKEIDKTGQTFFNGTYVKKGTAEGASAIAAMNLQLAKLKDQYKDAATQVEKFEAKEKEAVEKRKALKGPEEHGDKEKIKAGEAKFQQSLLEIHKETLTAKTQATRSWAEQERLALEQVEQENERHQVKLSQINANKDLNDKQKATLKEAEEEAHQARLSELEERRIDQHIQNIEKQKQATLDLSQFDELVEQQKAAVKQQADFQKQLIDQNEELSDQERQQRKVELEMQTQAEITRIQQQAFSERDALIQRSVYQSDNAAKQFADGFASGSKKAANELKNFGKQGQFVFNSLTSHAANAFMEIGEGAKSGSDIVKGAVMGMLADVAQSYGQMFLLAGLDPVESYLLPAGAALLVLAGYLRSQAKGSSGSSGFGGGGGGGGSIGSGGDIASVSTTPAQSTLLDEQQKQAKAVHLEVHGNIFDSDQTRQRLTELVRQSIDATDFSVARIGGGL